MPRKQLLLECLHAGGFLLGEVLAFVRVLAHVVEFEGRPRELFDELIVAGAEEAHRFAFADVAREVPVNGRAIEGGPGAQLLHETEPIGGLFLGQGGADGLEDCRHEVDAGDGFLERLAGRDDAGPTDGTGYAQAAFVEQAFAATQRADDIGQASVVGRENHQRVLGQAQALELGHDAADAYVDRFDGRRVFGGDAFVRPGGRLRLVLGE